MTKPFIASRMYLKPLAPGDMFSLDPEVVIKRSKRDLLKRIRQELTQSAFSDRAKKALAKAIEIEVKPSSLRIVSKHPAFGPLVRGQEKKQMTWLTKATRPIPIVTEDGEVIFRWATPRSMADGRWIHPGRPPATFIDRAKKTSREFLRKKFEEILHKQVRAAWKKR